MFKRRKKDIPMLNTSSTADISFMLLIFFLVTISLDNYKGISQKLPQITKTPPKEQTRIETQALLRLQITKTNELFMNDERVNVAKLSDKIFQFLKERESNHFIELKIDRQANYDAYFKVQDEIAIAYARFKEERALQIYNLSFAQLSIEEQKDIENTYPLHLSEIYEENIFGVKGEAE